MVRIVSDGVTPMKDEPKVHLLGWFLMAKRHGSGLESIGQNFPQSLPSRNSQFTRLEEEENLKNKCGW